MRMQRLLPVVPLIPSLLWGACGVPEAGAIDLSAHEVDTWRGLSLQDDRLHLIAEGRGIFEIDLDGNLVNERLVGDAGLVNAPYHDVATVDAAYVLLADDQGWLYDPQAETATVHFCVLPGDFLGPITRQKNDAVAVDVDTIYATPRFYEIDDNGNETLTSSELRSYDLASGDPTGFVALDRNLELRGLTSVGGTLLGVDDRNVYELDAQGHIVHETSVAGVSDAVGIAANGAHVFVLDAEADRISIVPIDSVRR